MDYKRIPPSSSRSNPQFVKGIFRYSLPSKLKACQSACCQSDSNGMDTVRQVLFPSATLVLSTIGTDVLKGFVTLDGSKISKAEIQLHLPNWNKGHPVPVHLHPDHPTILPQISTCETLIDIAIQSIISARYEKSSPLVESFLENAIQYCRQALETLENSDNSFPMVPAVFSGAPEDLSVSFGVQNARIVAAAYVANPHAGATAMSTFSGSSLRGASRSSLVSHPLIPPHEMLVKVDSIVPALTAAHEMLAHCISNLSSLLSPLQKMRNLVDKK